MLLNLLSKKLLLDQDFISNLALTASVRYKHYSIPKKNGEQRLIFHPSKELKSLQRVLHEDILSLLPIHKAAFAYRKGINLSAHALNHVEGKYFLRMDFKNFFESIKYKDVERFIDENKHFISKDWVKADTQLLCQIVCYKKSLTIGSVTSPVLTNAICHRLDILIENICHSKDVTYTRYADDLYFSTNVPHILIQIQKSVIKIVSELKLPSSLKINTIKTHHSSKKNRVSVTGLVITHDKKVSIGRDQKRYIRSMVYNWSTIGEKEKKYLTGYLSYCISVEPEFINSLCNKYGSDLIIKIQKYQC